MTVKRPLDPQTKKILLAVGATALLLLMTAVWVLFAYIQVHKNRRYGYDRYTGYTATRYIAYRGYSDEYFDNTAEAFIAAGESDFFCGIETNIRRTKDGVWVCSHDDDPFADKSVKISASTYDEIRDLPLDLSEANEGANVDLPYVIPTYELYLDIVHAYEKTALIEIKGTYAAEDLAPVVKAATDGCGYERTTFMSFSLSSVEAVKQCDVYVRTLVLSGKAFPAFCYTQMGRHVGVNAKIATKGLIERAHKKNTAAYVYNVTTKETAETLTEWKADFIITNGKLF